ncbi:DUF1707 domain-containing protein [Actinosynnema sp. NPDC047251]|uniref:DUF1707 domain-containing protein n=1 Tax=Saccharothrix espanaensis (strain ATCC 51144 / DSM 44229 / JCM 9112 / NBRC 15066 / NRRL 15764) TaxID=1179773 RepID=K0KBX4_SACES|nr:DUF1707 domain-containing protein [Saccharothrix espanaensis]CCH35701.1 hypothetical protein BN6_84870 [Saccharothrix espanaensis DSM 44229]
MTDPRQWRVSDAEREHVVELLQKAVGRGLITLDEFTERSDTALAAKTREELNVVLLDLTGLVSTEQQQFAAVQGLAAGHAPGAVAGFGQDRQVELKSTFSSVRRKGSWVVPRTMVVRSRMGSTDLDFREATIAHAVVDIELDVMAGSVKLVLPEGASVDADGVQLAAGSLKDKVGGAGGRPHFVLRGNVTGGSLEIKTKGRWFGNA